MPLRAQGLMGKESQQEQDISSAQPCLSMLNSRSFWAFHHRANSAVAGRKMPLRAQRLMGKESQQEQEISSAQPCLSMLKRCLSL
ncbi:hypothetical protein ATO46_07835 [Aeromonas schubertii]|nr:hypothetical protein ATO46_07835 [Aeromonas schubertii]